MSSLHNLEEGYLEALAEGEVVNLRLPAVGKTFKILKAMLCRRSAYFRGLLQLNLSPNPTNTIDLDDVSVAVLFSLLGWLYHNNLFLLFKDPYPVCFKDLAHVVDIYIFADKYDFIYLRNTCVTLFAEMVDEDRRHPKDFTEEIWHAFDKAFSRLPETARFRQFLLSWLCFTLKTTQGLNFDGTAFDRMATSLPPHVFIEIARSYVQQQQGGSGPTYADRYNGNANYWHESDDASDC